MERVEKEGGQWLETNECRILKVATLLDGKYSLSRGVARPSVSCWVMASLDVSWTKPGPHKVLETCLCGLGGRESMEQANSD